MSENSERPTSTDTPVVEHAFDPVVASMAQSAQQKQVDTTPVPAHTTVVTQASEQLEQNKEAATSTLKRGSDNWPTATPEADGLLPWDKIMDVCMKLQPLAGSCELDTRATCGADHIIRKINFVDVEGKELGAWVVKARTQKSRSEAGNEQDEVANFENEYYAMSFLGERKFPVPKAYHLDRGETCGQPFVVLEYIQGYNALDWARELKKKPGDETRKKVVGLLRQMAGIHYRLSRFRYPAIGKLRYSEKTKSYDIAPIYGAPEPFQSPEAFYYALVDHAEKYWRKRSPGNETMSLEVLQAFRELIPYFDCRQPEESYGLCNLDLGFHNLLVDDDGKILAMVDVDGVEAVPLAYCARPPILSNIHLPKSISSSERTQRRLKLYVDRIKWHEDRNAETLGGPRLSDEIGSDLSTALVALGEMGYNNGEVNAHWTSVMTRMREEGSR